MNSSIRILIADDDKDDAAFLSEGISKIIGNCTIFNVLDGGECMRFLKTNCLPDLIFLDLKMPLKSGIRMLKSNKRKRNA